MGLHSSRVGRVGDGIARIDDGSPNFFQRVEDAGVTIGEGRGGFGLPDAVI